MSTMTPHEQAVRYYQIYRTDLDGWMSVHPRAPRWIAEKIVAAKNRAARRRAARSAIWGARSSGMTIDSWRREPGSSCGAICRAVHRETGMSGDAVRRIAGAVYSRPLGWYVDYAAMDSVPDSACGGVVGAIRRDGAYHSPRHGGSVWDVAWAESHHSGMGLQSLILMAITDAVRLDIGEHAARKILAGTGPVSGYLADDLTGWLSGRSDAPGRYEECSGGEAYTWLRLHPETWATLAARMPSGAVTETAIQCYPHEHARAEACRRAGLLHTMRLSDSVYTGAPAQIAAAVAMMEAE